MSTRGYHRPATSTRFLTMALPIVLPRARITQYIALTRSLRVLRGRREWRRMRRFVSRLLLLSCGIVFVLFSLGLCSPARADDFGGGAEIIPYTPPGSDFATSSSGSLTFYSDYLWLTSGGVYGTLSSFSTTKGLAKPGDILAISFYRWNTGHSSRQLPVPNTNNAWQTFDNISWLAVAKPGYSRFLRVEGNTAYFRCISVEYCWTGEVASVVTSYGGVNNGWVISSYLIRGAASEEVAAQELKQYQEIQGQDNSGSAQQDASENQEYKTKSDSLISSLKQVASAPATSCRLDLSAHGMAMPLDFCAGSRPPWVRPLLSIPLAVVSLLLSIHIVKSIFSEVERFRSGL